MAATTRAATKSAGRHQFVQAVHGVRYHVKDVARAVAFYTTHLGFTLEHQQLPAFASVSFGDAQILLAAPRHPDLGRCRMGSSRNRVGGIVWFFA